MPTYGTLPNGFATLPTIFLQSGFPLKITVYVWNCRPEDPPVVFRERGKVLELEEMMYLRKLSERQLLAMQTDIEEAMEYYDEDPLYSPTIKHAKQIKKSS